MGKTIIISSFGTSVTTSPRWMRIAGHTGASSTEAARDLMFHSAGTLSNLWCKVSVNSNTSIASTLQLRKNAANATQVISVAASATGDFEDTTHTDAVVSGDKVVLQVTAGNSLTITIKTISLIFDATTDHVTKLATFDFPFTTASTTTFAALTGSDQTTTEANVKCRMRKAGTLKNMCAYVRTSRATASTVRSRKNGANGNLSVSLTAATTGWFEDVANSDTVSAGEDWNYSLTTGTGVDSLSVSIGSEFVSTALNGILLSSTETPIAVTDNTNRYFSAGGYLVQSTTETGATGIQAKARFAFSASELTCLITQNDVSSASTLVLRSGAADTALTVSITGNTTGVFSDSTNIVAIVSTDLINYNLTVPTVSGAHTVTVSNIIMSTREPASFSRPVSDTVVVSDSIARVKAANRTQSETSISVGDSVVRAIVNSRALADTVVVSDSIARVKAAFRALSDTVSVNDSIAKMIALSRALADTVVVSDSIARVKAAMRTITDTAVSVGDSITKMIAFSRALADTVVVSDSIARVKDAFRALADTVVVSDSITRSVTNTRVLPETISVSEQLNKIYNALRGLPESTSVGDSVTRSVTNSRAISDPSVSVSDQVNKTYDANRSINEPSISVGDSVSITQALNRVLSEAVITVSDQLDKTLSFFRTLSDSVTSNDSVVRAVTNIRSLADSTGVSDVVDRLYNAFRSLGDNVTVSDDVDSQVTAGQNNFDIQLDDSVSVGDSVDRTVGSSRSLNENVGISDQIDRTIDLFRALSGYVNVSDSVSRAIALSRSLSDTISSSDSVQKFIGFFMSLFDSISVSDSVDRSVDNTRPLTDSVSGNDAVSRAVNNSRSLSDSVSSSDIVDRTIAFVRSLVDGTAISDLVTRAVTNLRNLVEFVSINDLIESVTTIQENVTNTDIVILLTDWLQENWTDDPASTVEHYLIPPKSKITFGSRFDMSAGTHSDMHVHIRNVNQDPHFLDTADKIEENSDIVSIYAEVRYIPDTPPDFSGNDAGAPSDMMWQIRSYITELIRSNPEQLEDLGVEVISIMQEIPDANTPADVHGQNVIENMYTVIIIVKCFYTLEITRQA